MNKNMYRSKQRSRSIEVCKPSCFLLTPAFCGIRDRGGVFGETGLVDFLSSSVSEWSESVVPF